MSVTLLQGSRRSVLHSPWLEHSAQQLPVGAPPRHACDGDLKYDSAQPQDCGDTWPSRKDDTRTLTSSPYALGTTCSSSAMGQVMQLTAASWGWY